MQSSKFSIVVIISVIASLTAKANYKDSVFQYQLPDSVKVNSFISDVRVGDIKTKKEINAGIRAGDVSILLGTERGKREIEFEFPKTAIIKASGIGTDTSAKGEIVWKYNWMPNEIYKLMLSTASDSAENFILYSGYIFLPKENKWKLLGTCKILGQWGYLKTPASFTYLPKKNAPLITFENIWCQRTNGSWKKMTETNSIVPVINLFPHLDSVQQSVIEKQVIESAIRDGKTDATQNRDGVYYTILKAGTGREVKVSDTVTVHYKGYLFSEGIIFDQTKVKPATFPLSRLIRGWQIGLSVSRIGGKIKLVIPSAIAYSIRTRGPKIPPNSILVFEIEVLDAKEGN